MNLKKKALVLAPTREIAVQITDVLTTIGKGCQGLVVHTLIGGFCVCVCVLTFFSSLMGGRGREGKEEGVDSWGVKKKKKNWGRTK